METRLWVYHMLEEVIQDEGEQTARGRGTWYESGRVLSEGGSVPMESGRVTLLAYTIDAFTCPEAPWLPIGIFWGVSHVGMISP